MQRHLCLFHVIVIDGNCSVPTKIALFFVERYRYRGGIYKPIKMNRSYIYPLIFVGTVFNMYLALQYLTTIHSQIELLRESYSKEYEHDLILILQSSRLSIIASDSTCTPMLRRCFPPSWKPFSIRKPIPLSVAPA